MSAKWPLDPASLHLSLARVPGSLAVATLFTCAVFATATGIVGAVVTLMGLLAFPQMLKAGYNTRLGAGAITAGGCLGILIPPSVLLIVYGATAGVSVVQLYAGAFFPGIMLAGLYVPGGGTLHFDGEPMPWSRLRQIATLIPQESEIFEASVRENLSFGEPRDDETLHEVLHASTFDEVLAATHGDLETPLSEGGFNLSGGQRQRLCLARGMLLARGSSLLLLDEPTSALDLYHQCQVVDAITRATHERQLITLVVVHDINLALGFSQQVVVLHHGRLAAAGPALEVINPQLLRDVYGVDASLEQVRGRPLVMVDGRLPSHSALG